MCWRQSIGYRICRIPHFGNPKLYATWIDETLNMMLRTLARHAHPRRLEYRVFQMFDMQGRLGATSHFFGADVVDDD